MAQRSIFGIMTFYFKKVRQDLKTVSSVNEKDYGIDARLHLGLILVGKPHRRCVFASLHPSQAALMLRDGWSEAKSITPYMQKPITACNGRRGATLFLISGQP